MGVELWKDILNRAETKCLNRVLNSDDPAGFPTYDAVNGLLDLLTSLFVIGDRYE